MKATALPLPLLLVLALVSACGKQGCSNLPLESGIQVQVPAAIQKLSPNLRVELCQGTTCKAVNFPSSSKDGGRDVAAGVTLDGDAYDVDLDVLGARWKADGAVGLTVIGTSKRGRVVLKHTEQFTWDTAYPNGEDCDDAPELKHSTSVGGDDLAG